MLPIYETFYSWQGEGCHMGKAAYFIRTFGCPVKCPWCDSAGTWHPDFIPSKIIRRTEEDLLGEALKTKAQFVVITGGEPTVHDLTKLTSVFRTNGMMTHLETSGAFTIRGNFDWITLSPKWAKLPLTSNLLAADEIKIIVENEDSIEKWWNLIGDDVCANNVWLHPEWSQRNNPKVIDSISQWVKEKSGQTRSFRAGYQLHRLYACDKLDPMSKPEVSINKT